MMILRPAAALAVATALAGAASAATSDVFKTEGGTVRLVTSGLAGPDGILRGVLEIALEPGWKTYWQDPGAAGVPPQIALGKSVNISGVEIGFPAPRWHDDGYGAWAGYDRPVRLPVTFSIPKPKRYSLIEADVFLGLCQTICIPAQARLTVEPGSDPDNAEHAKLVAEAFAALPSPAHAGFRVESVADRGEVLAVEATLPGDDADAQLFVVAAGGFSFGFPKAEWVDGRRVFLIPVLDRPKAAGQPVAMGYTLVSGADAVSGAFDIP